MSDQEGVPVNEQRCSEPEGTMELSKASEVDSRNKKLVEQNYYPSPDHSPSSSVVPALDEPLTDESEGDEDILPPTLAGRKRRLSSSGVGAHVPLSESTTRLKKRYAGLLCVLHTLILFLSNQPQPQYLFFSQCCLPSPVASAEEFLEDHQMSCSVPITQSFTNSKRRKRRISDADTTRLSKHPRDSMSGPRLHAVSDPLPLSTLESEHSIDGWFRTNFDALFALPPPVTTYCNLSKVVDLSHLQR